MRKAHYGFNQGYSLIILSLLIISCSGANISMPISDNDTGVSRAGEVVWMDLVTSDAGKSQSFFTQLNGWKYNNFGDYTRAMSGTKPVCGIIQDPELTKGEKNSYWVVSASVNDMDAASNKAIANGGKVLSEAKKIPDRGKVAIIQDGQGAVLALMNSSRGDLRATAAREGEWMWVELWTTEPKAASTFYQNVLSVQGELYSGTDDYYVLKAAEHAFAGITQTIAKEEGPIWIPVLNVADVTSTASKVKELDGSVLVNPVEISGHTVALVTTPSGAPFMIQEMK